MTLWQKLKFTWKTNHICVKVNRKVEMRQQLNSASWEKSLSTTWEFTSATLKAFQMQKTTAI